MPRDIPPDYYLALGVTANATAAQIKIHYRRLSKQHHPDKGGDPETMARINKAYAVLSDRFKRAIYDAERRQLQYAALAAQAKGHTLRSVGKTKVEGRTHRVPWWAKLATGLAIVGITLGLALRLPIAEVNTSASNDTHTSKPLDITYPADPPTPIAQSAPSAVNEPTASQEPTPPPEQSAQTTVETADETNKNKKHEFCKLLQQNAFSWNEQARRFCKNYPNDQ